MGNKTAGGQIAGYKYYLSVFMGICRGPVDGIVGIKVGDMVAWEGFVEATGSFSIDMPNLFGGEEKEGGIVGSVMAYFGQPDQILSAADRASLTGVATVDASGTSTVPVDVPPGEPGAIIEDPYADAGEGGAG